MTLFRLKVQFSGKKVCYKVSLCESHQRQCCKAFTGLSIRGKLAGGGRPLLREILAEPETDPRHPLQSTFSRNTHIAKKFN